MKLVVLVSATEAADNPYGPDEAVILDPHPDPPRSRSAATACYPGTSSQEAISTDVTLQIVYQTVGKVGGDPSRLVRRFVR